jgi:hypothetical protein
LKQVGKAVHLVENHQLIFMIREIEFRIGQFRPVHLRFEIKIDRGTTLSDLMGKCRLSNLVRSYRPTAG